MDKITLIRKSISDSVSVKQLIYSDIEMLKRISDSAEAIIDAYRDRHKVLWCGNGGSAADAQHLAAELSGRFYYDRPPLYSDALHCNTSYLTAVANDYGFDFVFSRLVSAQCTKGDVLIGISTSGNSRNVISAFESAHNIGVTTIAMTGSNGGQIKNFADIMINVPSTDTPRIQEAHIMIGHIICEIVESRIFPMNKSSLIL